MKDLLFILIWLVCATHSVLTQGTALCQDAVMVPPFCSSHVLPTGGAVINCTAAGITSLEINLQMNTAVLNLQRNHISMLLQNAFMGCNHLRQIDLSFNRIYSIQPKAFMGLDQLEILYLNNNYLNISSDISIDVSVFESILNLRILHIHNNLWLNTTEYRDDIFSPLQKLKTLAMDGVPNPYATLGPRFSYMISLEELYIPNGLTYIGNMTLMSLNNSNLRKLVVHSGLLMDLDALSFAHFPKLEELDLSYNPLLGLNNASKAWYGLKLTNISSLKLNHAVPFESQVIHVEESFYDNLDIKTIKELTLDGNNIITMYAKLNAKLPYLQALSISYNRLTHVNNVLKDIAALKYLRYINANYQTRRKKITEKGLIWGFGKPPVPKIEQIYGTSHPNHKIFKRSVGIDQGRLVTGGAPEPLPDPEILLDLQLPPQLEEIHLSESLSVDWYILPKTTMKGPSRLHHFEYSGNGIGILQGPIVLINEPMSELVFDFSRNQASYLNPDFFQYENVTKGKFISLLLSGNKLGPQMQSDENGSLFRNYVHLKILDLSDNVIKQLPWHIFSSLENLESLILSRNSLREVNFALGNLKHLKILNLSENLLSSLKSTTYNTLEQITNNITVNLADNPLICSCDTLDFMQWTTWTKVHLQDKEHYQCTFQGKLRLFSEVNIMISELKIMCSRTIIIVGITVPVVAIVIIVSLAFFCHRHKWEIRFWFMQSIVRKKPQVQSKTFQYDAFVSFQEGDLLFVKNQLIPNLEKYSRNPEEKNFKLVVHHRDFALGYPIVDNIFEAIDNSRKTLVILSNNFVESKWTYFELQMATMRTLDDGRDIIIVIILEPVPAEKMTSALLQLLQHNTYIEWPSNPADRPLFWQRLREAIQRDVPRPVRCQTCANIVYQKKPQKKKKQKQCQESILFLPPELVHKGVQNPVFIDSDHEEESNAHPGPSRQNIAVDRSEAMNINNRNRQREVIQWNYDNEIHN